MNKINIFVSYAPDDKKAGTVISDQCRNPFSSFAVIGGSDDALEHDDWETITRGRIKQAKIVIMVIGQTTAHAVNVIREIKIAREEGIPILGIFTDKTYEDMVPETFGSGPVIEWNWEHVSNTIQMLVSNTIVRRGIG